MSDPTPLDPPPPAEDTPTLEHPIEDGTPCLACQAAEARP